MDAHREIVDLAGGIILSNIIIIGLVRSQIMTIVPSGQTTNLLDVQMKAAAGRRPTYRATALGQCPSSRWSAAASRATGQPGIQYIQIYR